MANFFHQTLQRLEKHLQALIEGSTARLFPIDDFQKNLGKRLVETLRSEIHPDNAGNLIAPNLFTIFMPEEQALIYQSQPEFINELAEYLRQACRANQVVFVSEPTIKVLANPEIEKAEIQIVAQFSLGQEEETSTLEPFQQFVSPGQNLKAFLIIDGIDTFQLDGRTIQIGRSPENELVINHPQVSPMHAQLRQINGTYSIFDLNSAGGTFVNGMKISQSVLHPGDVISLGGIPLVFGIEHPTDLDRTQELKP